MGQLWDLVEAHKAKFNPNPPSNRRLAMQVGMSPTAFGNWENDLSRLPDRGNLLAFADLTAVPYTRVLDAALSDCRYLPESVAREAHEQAKAEQTLDRKVLVSFMTARLGVTFHELLNKSAGERRELVPQFADKGDTPEEKWLLTNARAFLRGDIVAPPWELVDMAQAGRIDELLDDMDAAERGTLVPIAKPRVSDTPLGGDAHPDAAGVSEQVDRTDDEVAAHEEAESISGEQEQTESS